MPLVPQRRTLFNATNVFGKVLKGEDLHTRGPKTSNITLLIGIDLEDTVIAESS